MKIAHSSISLKGLRFRARHGVLPQERVVGGDYVVDVRVDYPLATAVSSDRVADTLDYSEVYRLVAEEMEQPSCLLEHVAGRMAHRLADTFPLIERIRIAITKTNPPMGADGQGATVEITWGRE